MKHLLYENIKNKRQLICAFYCFIKELLSNEALHHQCIQLVMNIKISGICSRYLQFFYQHHQINIDETDKTTNLQKCPWVRWLQMNFTHFLITRKCNENQKHKNEVKPHALIYCYRSHLFSIKINPLATINIIDGLCSEIIVIIAYRKNL